LERTVALKMVRTWGTTNADDIPRFQLEARTLAALPHPGIVQIFDTGLHDGQPYAALEFCAGGTLTSKSAGQPVEPRQAARWLVDIARAVQAAHAANIIHRDLKPQNILLTADGQLKVTDFGLAKRLQVDDHLTQTGLIAGTPAYMAPEQALGETIGPLADVWALGIIFYELLTGRVPFAAASPIGILQQVLDDDPVPPRRLNPTLPRDLETVCLKCLEKTPARRYASAAALADDLQRYLDGRTLHARPVGVLTRVWRWTRRHPTAATALTTLVVGTVVSTVFGIQAVRSSERMKQALTELKTATPFVSTSSPTQVIADLEDELRLLTAGVGANAPRGSEARLRLATAYYALGQPDRAADLLAEQPARPLIVGGVPNISALTSLSARGCALREAGRAEEAIPIFSQILHTWRQTNSGRTRDNVAAEENLAEAYAKLGRYADAAHLYEQTLRMHRHAAEKSPELPTGSARDYSLVIRIVARLADLYEADGRYETALPHRQEAWELRQRLLPTDARTFDAQRRYGECLAQRERWADAERHLLASYTQLAQAERVPPAWPTQFRQGLCHFYERWGKPDQAERYRDRERLPAPRLADSRSP
jgi:tetratricopeptide (TPR) repeat protein